ncbi:MAG: Gfo/Idh/MocA family protein [Rickettsiales bacterium]
MSKQTHIGIIGCGKQAEKHITSLQKLPDIAITVADVDTNRAQQLAERFGVKTAEVDTFFTDPSIQAIAICTPTPTHAAFIEKATSNGKAFFCEKPLCASLKDAEAIQTACSNHQARGLVGYIYRYSPVFQTAHDLLKQPHNTSPFGKPVMATLRIGGRGSHQLWKHKTETGGGVMNEMLVHMVDLAYWLFGEIKEAHLLKKSLLRDKRVIGGTLHEVDAEDFVLAELVTTSGISIYIQADLLTPGFSQHIEIQGEEGSFMGSIQPDIPARLFSSKEVSGYQKGWNLLPASRVNLLDEQMAHFVQLINDPTMTPKTTIDDSLALMAIMDKLQQKENI